MPHPLVDALLYGRMNGVPEDTIFLFARTGLIHCFSASGFHMGVALALASLAGRALRPLLGSANLSAAVSFALSLAMMIFFATKTDWSSPMVRAFTFSTLVTAAKLLEVSPTKARLFWLSVLAAACFGGGSWLSFALSGLGMAALVFVRPRHAWALLLAPWAATLPLSLFFFHLFSLAAPFWNLTVGAALGAFVLPPAIFALLLESARIPGGELLFAAAERVMGWLVGWLARGDACLGLSYWVEPLPFFLVAGAFLLAVALFPRRWAILPLAAAVATVFLFPAPYLAALRVGQGDSIYLRTPAGARLLVDTGPPPWPAGRSAASAASLEALGRGAVDHLLLSHLDRDHVGGTAGFLARHRVREALWLRPSLAADGRLLPILEAAERSGTSVRWLHAAPLPGVRCWLPPADSSNEGSAVCRAELAGGRAVWLTGDAGFPTERWLLAQGPLPPAYFLKVAHHGSRFSSSDAFLRATGAHEALVSVGPRNRYGHPTPETLGRLEAAGFLVHRTDREGSVVYR